MPTTQHKPKRGTLALNRAVFDALLAARNVKSADEQARYIGVSRATLYRVRDGAAPGSEFVASAVANLGVGVGDLFTVTVR